MPRDQGLRWILGLAAFPLLYFFWNWNNHGPLLMDDEIGYLAKAALLGGQVVDGASSFHGGYSMLLAPLFALLSTPAAIWTGVKVINALLWYGALLLLNRLITLCRGDMPAPVRLGALAVSGLYPAWLNVAGVAYTTSAFTCFFMLSAVALCAWRQNRSHSIAGHSLCVGFLYWIHPLGAAVALASLIAVAALCRQWRDYRPLGLHGGIVLGMLVLYKYGIHGWLDQGMTPPGYVDFEHYDQLTASTGALLRAQFFSGVAVKVLGQLAASWIASFGIVLFGLIYCYRHGSRLWRRATPLPATSGGVATWPALSLYFMLSYGIIAGTGALMFSVHGLTHTLRTDHWIYSRYIESVSLPLLALGWLRLTDSSARERQRVAVAATVLALVAGWGLAAMHPAMNDFSQLASIAFFPYSLYSGGSFPVWMAMGGAGMLLVAIGGKRVAIALFLVSIIITVPSLGDWEATLSKRYDNPALAAFIRENYAAGTCVGFDDVVPAGVASTFASLAESRANYNLQRYVEPYNDQQLQRYALFEFYLFDYRYRRVSVQQWERGCDGPLLTFDAAPLQGRADLLAVAREMKDGLYLFVRRSDRPLALSALRADSRVVLLAAPHDPAGFVTRTASGDAGIDVGKTVTK